MSRDSTRSISLYSQREPESIGHTYTHDMDPTGLVWVSFVNGHPMHPIVLSPIQCCT